METKNIFKGLAMGGLILVIFSIVACGDSDNKRVATTPATGVNVVTTAGGTTYTTCHDCGNSNLIASSVGDSISGFVDSFQFRLNFFYANDGHGVAVDGAVDIANLGSVGQCGFLPGRYQVATVNNEYGQLDNTGLVRNVSLEAYKGSEKIRMRINYATFNLFSNTFIKGCDNRNYADPLGAEIVIESLNGKSCVLGTFSKKLYPTGDKGFDCNSI